MGGLSSALSCGSGRRPSVNGMLDDAEGPLEPETGLSRREKDCIRESWAELAKDMRASGSAVFLAIFRTYPEYQKRFPRLRHMEYSQLIKSPRLAAHAMTFMRSMHNLVSNLDDVKLLKELLEGISRRHKMLGFSRTDFEKVFGVFYVVLDSLPVMDQLSHSKETIIDSWRHAGVVICSVIGAGMDAMEQENDDVART